MVLSRRAFVVHPVSRAILPAVLFSVFASANLLGLPGAIALLRRGGRHSEWAGSLTFSSAGAIGGGVLFIELSLRLVARLLGVSIYGSPIYPLTFWLGFIWFLVASPVCFLAAFLVRAKATPRQVYLLQTLQVLTWAWSGALLLATTTLS